MRGNSKYFLQFIHQLKQNFHNKRIVIIADNVSYHKSKRVKQNIKNKEDVTILYLPTYSPEYNPVEQIWRWLKPIVHGIVSVKKGIAEILQRIRKIIWHWRNGSLVNSLNVGNGIWDDLIINIYGE